MKKFTKEFNVTGSCVPHMHYMVDISHKLIEIKKLIDAGKYFTINRARQYGKTTTRYAIKRYIQESYIVINISFEGIGDLIFEEEKNFTSGIFNIFADSFSFFDEKIESSLREYGCNVENFNSLSKAVTKFCMSQSKEVVLIIDEVDKSSNNQLFLSFLGMLRDKYLARNNGEDVTFHSVILLSVYDIKNLKLRLRLNEERKYNSPWNIAADFDINMSFNASEISSMLVEYEKDHCTQMDISKISFEICQYTNGYPFLVSKLCKIIDEKLKKTWTAEGIEQAVKILLDERNTLFDDLIKNLENNRELYNLIYNILIKGKKFSFNIHTPMIDRGVMLGFFEKKNGFVGISNKIFELCIYNYMISKKNIEEGDLLKYEYRSNFIIDNKLNMEMVLNKFQEIMHDEYRQRDNKFIEREGRLIFLCFLKPIINGIGFYYVEAETRMDNRMDIVVTYGKEQHIIELKIWHGENYEEQALEQLASYLESKRETKGYLISYNFNKNKEYSKEWKRCKGKDIYSIVV